MATAFSVLPIPRCARERLHRLSASPARLSAARYPSMACSRKARPSAYRPWCSEMSPRSLATQLTAVASRADSASVMADSACSAACWMRPETSRTLVRVVRARPCARASPASSVASRIARAVVSYWWELAPDSVRSLAAHSRSTARRSLAVPAHCRTHASSGAASLYSQSSAAEPSSNVSPGYSVGSRPSTSRSPGRSIA